MPLWVATVRCGSARRIVGLLKRYHGYRSAAVTREVCDRFADGWRAYPLYKLRYQHQRQEDTTPPGQRVCVPAALRYSVQVADFDPLVGPTPLCGLVRGHRLAVPVTPCRQSLRTYAFTDKVAAHGLGTLLR